MIILGFTIVWGLLLWLLQPHFSHLLSSWTTIDRKRISKLQDQLHDNFIFHARANDWIGFIPFSSLWIKFIEKKRKKRFQHQLLHFIPSLSSMLKTGHGLEKSFHSLANSSEPPLQDELRYMLKEVRLGLPLQTSLEKLGDRHPSENMLMFVHAISISRKLGTSLSEVMDNIGANIMEKEKLRQQVHSLASQGKLQAWVATAMPFFLALVLRFLSPHYFDPLFSTFLGQCCLMYCGVSMTLGLLWIRSITHREYL